GRGGRRPGGGERARPPLVAEARELEVESLARHAGGDEAHAAPAVEPAPAVARDRQEIGSGGKPHRREGRDEEAAPLREGEPRPVHSHRAVTTPRAAG